MDDESRCAVYAFAQRPLRFDVSARNGLRSLSYYRPGWVAEISAEGNGDEWAAIVNRQRYRWTAGLAIARRGYVCLADSNLNRCGVFVTIDDLTIALLAFVDCIDREAEEERPEISWGDVIMPPSNAFRSPAKVSRAAHSLQRARNKSRHIGGKIAP